MQMILLIQIKEDQFCYRGNLTQPNQFICGPTHFTDVETKHFMLCDFLQTKSSDTHCRCVILARKRAAFHLRISLKIWLGRRDYMFWRGFRYRLGTSSHRCSHAQHCRHNKHTHFFDPLLRRGSRSHDQGRPAVDETQTHTLTHTHTKA